MRPCPEVTALRWNYDKEEIIADGIVHAVGVTFGIVSFTALLVMAAPAVGAWELTSILVYGIGLLTVLTVSALYNLWPVSPVKWMLRRYDHSAIYLLIAGTYTPFLVGALRGPWGTGLLAAEWGLAVLGVAAKVRFGFRWRGLSTAVYLVMGWLAAVAAKPLLTAVGVPGFLWLLAGGLCYTAGVAFYATDRRLRYGHAVWHLFVAGGSACHVWAALRHAGGAG